MDEEVKKLLSEIASLWNRIEARAKAAEHFRGEAIIAAINEMRYAGRRIADVLMALSTNGWKLTAEVRENLIIAKNYLVNADHDVTDGICFFAHTRFRKIIDQHGAERVKALCPEFVDLYPELVKAEQIISGSREDRRVRAEKYEQLAKDYCPRVMEVYAKLRGIRELSLMDNLPEQLSILQRYVRIVTWVAFVGSVASILGLIISIVALTSV